MAQGETAGDVRPKGCGRPYDPHFGITWSSGAGVWLTDSDGKKYLDCVSGYSANNFGHAHPKIVAAIESSARKIGWAIGAETCERRDLERTLCELFAREVAMLDFKALAAKRSPDQRPAARSSHEQSEALQIKALRSPLKAWISTTGSRAIEIAWKISNRVKPGVIARFNLSFHGRSIATSAISQSVDSFEKEIFNGILRSGHATTFGERFEWQNFAIPYPIRSERLELDDACERSLLLSKEFFENHGDRITALLLEPAIGARGYYFAPHEYFRKLVAMARKHGITVISDEIQMGLGRLGGWTASGVQGWEPDLWVIGKSLGGGLVPISAVIGGAHWMDSLPIGAESETYAATALSCSVASCVCDLLQDGQLIRKSAEKHTQIRRALGNILGDTSVLGEGSATVIDFSEVARRFLGARFEDEIELKRNCEIASKVAYDFVSEARRRGVLLHLTGPLRDRVAIIPPLVISELELSFLLDALQSTWIATTSFVSVGVDS